MDRCWKGIAITIAVLIFCVFAVTAEAQGSGKFQVVAGTGDNAYLVNTETGAVWVLTQRTLVSGTGREPVAIPYKFQYLSPDQNMYLDEEGRKVPFKVRK